MFEVATFRKDIGSDGRRPERVEFCSFEEDAKRRDFTINALGLNSSMMVIDHVGGMDDLVNRKIRFIGDPGARIEEDKLRMLRAFRFKGQLVFMIEARSLKAIWTLGHKIREVSAERIFAEMDKILQTPHVSPVLAQMMRTGFLGLIFPELEEMVDLEQPEKFHPEGDVWTHTKMVVDRVNMATRRGVSHLSDMDRSVMMWAALLHDVGKIRTQEVHEDGRITFHGHDSTGAKMVREDIMPRLKASAELRDRVSELVKKHMVLCQVDKMKKSTIKKLIRKDGGNFLPLLTMLHAADAMASSGDLGNLATLEERKQGIDLTRPLVTVTGRDLIDIGIKPGKNFGKLLSALNELVLNEEITGRRSALELGMFFLIASVLVKRPGDALFEKKEEQMTLLRSWVEVLKEIRPPRKEGSDWEFPYDFEEMIKIIRESSRRLNTEREKNNV
jgi:poly(A) polymerase